MNARFHSPACFSRLPGFIIMVIVTTMMALSSGRVRRLETGYGSSRAGRASTARVPSPGCYGAGGTRSEPHGG